MSVYYNKDKTLARVSCDDGWFLINREGKRIGDIYTYMEEWADGYYLVEKGAKKNILRMDGSMVLKEWHNNIYEFSEGFFFYGNTIPKSKNNPNTKYIRGLAHVDGNVIFPMIFTYARWRESDLFYAEIDDKPYLLSTDGSIYDYARGHMPKRIRIDEFQLFNDYLNWTFSDLQFFYRDTDTTIDVKNTYHVGDIFRAGFYVDMTYKLQRPAHKTRFLIASAHAAKMCEVVGAYMLNPDLEKWGLCTLHFNSYLRVMDVYEKDGVTQVFLLHIPGVARHLFRGSWFDFKLKTENKNHGEILIDDARKSLDEKLTMEVHSLSMDKEFVERMSHPVGLDSKFRLYPIERMDETFSKDVAELSEFIHKIANDADIEMYKELDNFPYKGVEGAVCEGCIYSKEISGNGLNCGNLSTEPFRLRYIRRSCEYKKTDIGVLSKYEQVKKEEEERAKEHLEKSTDVFAFNLLRAFVRERMGGNVKNLKYFDFSTLNDDTKYGNGRTYSNSNRFTTLARAIVSLVFSDVWKDLTYEGMEKEKYFTDIINITNTLFGFRNGDNYSALDNIDAPQSLRDRVARFGRKENTIGNIMVIPSGWGRLRDTKALGRCYTDIFLREVHKMMTQEKKFNWDLVTCLGLKKNEFYEFRTGENFQRIVRGLMLDDFLDETGQPKQVFMGLFYWEKNYTRDDYLKAAEEYLDFCEPFIDKRADRIIERLQTILG